MNVLIIADAYPMPDRNSGDFRFFNLIGMIGQEHEVAFIALGESRQAQEIGRELTAHYRRVIADSGVQVLDGIAAALRSGTYDCVLFEWYFTATRLVEVVRELQPGARLVVDAVDVVFNRMQSKARVTQDATDLAHAAEVRRDELAVYAGADLVLTVTDADAEILQRALPEVRTFTVPNIHPLQEFTATPANPGKNLIFIGSFTHEPNIDAMRYFCEEVLPLIAESEPQVRLRIVGNAPTPEVRRLASERVEVLGYVPETRPYLETSTVSIAPLRFGGGMKGKIGEAMSCGLPVVTSSVGIEGFGLVPNEHVLVADDARSFADAVIRLLRDRDFLEKTRMAGYRFIRDRYSDVAVRRRVHTLFDQLGQYPIKRMPRSRLGLRKAKALWQRHVAWRFR